MQINSEAQGDLRCPQDKLNWSWEALMDSISDCIRNNGLAFFIFVLCLYNLSKFKITRKIWAKSKGLLPHYLRSQSVDERIDAMTAELRMEMRGLSEQIIEFQKWSHIMNCDEAARGKLRFCRGCRMRMLPPPEVSVPKSNAFINQAAIESKMSECSWLQYLHKYVHNPNPRILDTGELENTKRVYSM